MDTQKMISKWYVVVGVALLLYGTGYMQGKGNKEVEVREVTKTVVDEQIREKVITLPGGEKVVYRVIDRKEVIDRDYSIKKNPKRLWGITVLGPLQSRVESHGASWTVGVDYRILPDVFAGVYGRMDGELGFSLRYEF